jgi:hypothetical protein
VADTFDPDVFDLEVFDALLPTAVVTLEAESGAIVTLSAAA